MKTISQLFVPHLFFINLSSYPHLLSISPLLPLPSLIPSSLPFCFPLLSSIRISSIPISSIPLSSIPSFLLISFTLSIPASVLISVLISAIIFVIISVLISFFLHELSWTS